VDLSRVHAASIASAASRIRNGSMGARKRIQAMMKTTVANRAGVSQK